MEFSNLLFSLLKEFNITQARLSKETGIPKTTISGWLTAGKLPDYNSIKTLCLYFGISADELLQIENSSENLLSNEEKLLLHSYKLASSHTQQIVLNILTGKSNNQS